MSTFVTITNANQLLDEFDIEQEMEENEEQEDVALSLIDLVAQSFRNNFESMEPQELQHVCASHAKERYATALDAAMYYCDQCHHLICPKSFNSTEMQAVCVPASLRRDTQLKTLCTIYQDYTRSVRTALQALTQGVDTAVSSLYTCQDFFQEEDNPIFHELKSAVVNHKKEMQRYRRDSEEDMLYFKKKLLRAIHMHLPRDKATFTSITKKRIQKRNPVPFPIPTKGDPCALCNNCTSNVRLYQKKKKIERVRVPIEMSTGVGYKEEMRVVAPCSCKEFNCCMDCLLDWYWEKSDHLQKSFGTCPTCRAEFQLQDIMPVVYTEPE
jgi:Putative transmembrane protein precursor